MAEVDGNARREVEAVILGGGISGIAASIRLRREAGLRDIVLIEQGAALGGTWYWNTYPGATCDIPSSLYSFEFAPNPGWTRVFAPQPEILEYVQRVADEHGVPGHTLFGTRVTAARWDEDTKRWLIDTDNRGGFSTPVFVFGVGALHEPNTPDVPGVDRFEGTQFHTARWDHDQDLTGKRVALVGSGATAIQALPELQKVVRRLTYFQRTPGWVWPKPDWRTTKAERALYRRLPFTQKILRAGQFGFAEFLIVLYRSAKVARLLNIIGRLHMFLTVRDRKLRRKLRPSYATGCKRIMIANTYYPAVGKPNVDVLASGLREVRANSVVADDGSEHEVDTIIWATGFHAIDPPILAHITGRDGLTLAEVWKDTPRAYMGTSMNGFPNAYQIWGPNAGTGCNFVMVEAQVNYIVESVKLMQRNRKSSLDIRPEVVEAWKSEMSSKLAGSTWVVGGCTSWYQDGQGDIHAIYGGQMAGYLRRSRKVDLDQFTAAP